MTDRRTIGPYQVNRLGLGCMNVSHGYGPADETEAERLLHRALDLGCDFLDTAAVYGDGHNELLIGRVLKARRGEFTLASKCGFRAGGNARTIDGSPAAIAETLDRSLSRLGLDHIDLYYLHRPDPRTPIEESVGALARAVEAGKIGAIGLSEVSADQLRRGHAVHPIAALQTEYSLWTRNPEIAGLAACHELGIAFVAFSPLGRGFLAGGYTDPSQLVDGDMRRFMPRFQPPNLSHNLAWLAEYRAMADGIGCTPAQLALAWLLHRDRDLIAIPGTRSLAHLEENMAAGTLHLSPAQVEAVGAMVNERTVAGPRYAPAMQATVTTEEFA